MATPITPSVEESKREKEKKVKGATPLEALFAIGEVHKEFFGKLEIHFSRDL